ncbi:nitroreductase [Mycobacterium frederiksbergense]|uniref:Nitroreductase n=1 Tax=Mycolicibacterium frederiksbergense TaxID=117567 RepID=A0ABT6KTT7_9MYCO|nr:NAD(P)H nitroreductase [Mycolicibacterium frederiksbergense]MDH6194013.1 nitroreductase [Mycolicibacterium frederiksbergense]
MPGTQLSTDVIMKSVHLACRAPSLHNSQPWLWITENDTVDLFLDKDRVLYSTDHSGREAVIGCGAVLDHFRVAMAAAGWTANYDRMPNPNNPLHLASLDFGPLDLVTEGHRRRAEAILLRYTDRLPFAEPPDWDSVESRLRRSVMSDAVVLDSIADDLRPELAQASQLTESLRLYDSSYHSELRWWTGPFETREGIPHSSLPSPSERERVDINRTFPVSHHSDRRAGVGHDHSKVLVLSTYDNDRSSVLQCGEALSAVLLEATLAGLATCTLTHITELAASRRIVASLIDRTTTPQLLIRVGLAAKGEDRPPATPRRPLDEVLHVRSGPRSGR